MPQTFQEIYDCLIEGKKIKPNSKFENSLKIKARKIVEKQEFEELKARIISMADKLIQLGIMNSAPYRLIKNSQNKAQLDEQILKLTKNFLDVISSMSIEKSTVEEKILLEGEIKNLKNLHATQLKETDYNFKKIVKKLNKENKNLTSNIKKLSNELKKFSTPAENIKDHVSAYLDLLKKKPSKTPTPDILEKYSVGKIFELKRSSWYELMKTNNFIQSLAIKLQNEFEKILPKIQKYEDEIEDLKYKIKFEKDDVVIIAMNKEIEKLILKKNKLTELTDSLEKHKELYSKKIFDAAKKKKKYTPNIDQISDKEAYDNYSEDTLDNAIDDSN